MWQNSSGWRQQRSSPAWRSVLRVSKRNSDRSNVAWVTLGASRPVVQAGSSNDAAPSPRCVGPATWHGERLRRLTYRRSPLRDLKGEYLPATGSLHPDVADPRSIVLILRVNDPA